MRRAHGLGLLDLVVALALLAVLVWLLRLDWRRLNRPGDGGHTGTRSSWTSV